LPVPQAKGGIERLWETLQDRLAKDMQRKGISSIEEANESALNIN